MRATRRLADGRPEGRIWHDAIAQYKVVQMQARREMGAVGGVVFMGSSQTLEGVDPAVVAPGLGARAYNAALHRSVFPINERWLDDVVIPILQPKLVVLGLGPAEFNERGMIQKEVLTRYLSAPAVRPGLPYAFNRWLHDRSYLYRRATGWRRPKVRFADLRIGSNGQGIEYATTTEYRLSEKKRAFIEDEVFNDYATGPTTVGLLERIATRVRATGAEIVIFALPFTDQLFEMVPGGRDTIAEYREVALRSAEALGLRFIRDLEHLTDRSLHADCLHFNVMGMRRASEVLADRLAEELARVG